MLLAFWGNSACGVPALEGTPEVPGPGVVDLGDGWTADRVCADQVAAWRAATRAAHVGTPIPHMPVAIPDVEAEIAAQVRAQLQEDLRPEPLWDPRVYFSKSHPRLEALGEASAAGDPDLDADLLPEAMLGPAQYDDAHPASAALAYIRAVLDPFWSGLVGARLGPYETLPDPVRMERAHQLLTVLQRSVPLYALLRVWGMRIPLGAYGSYHTILEAALDHRAQPAWRAAFGTASTVDILRERVRIQALRLDLAQRTAALGSAQEVVLAGLVGGQLEMLRMVQSALHAGQSRVAMVLPHG